MINDEYCVSYSDFEQCMSGELLFAAIVLECGLYFITFVFGWKIIEAIKKKIKRKKKDSF
mgnify:CR=1 FL=1|tara:strand:- start:2232 stop:2411 length:180 start_codon:yes stop_codon:yes gene_type:complete